MKQLFILLGLVCLITMLLPACAPAPEPEPVAAPEPVFDQAAEEAAIREVIEQVYALANKHDAKGFVALMDESIEDWDGENKGRAAQEKGISEWWERQTDIQYKLLDEIGIVFVTPDVAIYKWHDHTTGELDEDGKPLPPSKWLEADVFVKKNDKWLIAAYFEKRIEE